jgi:4-amino-4-deoxy-L-arabinose transferase-like glycosyltransferase
VLLIGALVLARKESRAGLVVWGGWLVVTAAVFSYMNGIIHPYYTVALAPAIGAVIGIGATELWRRRRADPLTVAVLSGAVALTALEAYFLLREWSSGFAVTVMVLGLVAAACFPLTPRIAVPLALVAALAGPFAYSVVTASTPHTGAIPTAGPANARFGGMRGGGMGGLLDATAPGANLVSLLQATTSTWAAAAVGSNNAAGYQLGSGRPVMAVGGFNGTDPSPTLAEFQELVRTKQVHYFLGGAGMSGSTGSDASQEIASWVEQNFAGTTVDGVAVYDLTAGAQA